MKKYFYFVILLFCFCSLTQAQDSIQTQKYALTTVNNRIGYTSFRLIDNYLSPLKYDGGGLKFESERRRFFSPDKMNLSRQTKIDLLLAATTNPAGNASIYYIGLDYAWGMHYHFRPIKKLQLLAGGLAMADLGAKMNSRNVNNPFNIDFSMGIEPSLVIIYDPHRNIRLQASFNSPVIGFMFAPELGESYYEMFNLDSDSKYFHFSSPHNRVGFRQMYTTYFTLGRSVLSASYCHDYLRYEANDIFFKKVESTFSIGWAYNMRIFAGRKNEAPSNFVKY
jgi:hypothetical protein